MFGDINFDPDVSSWDMSNAVNLSSMFFDSRTNPDVSNWNVKNVKDISSMFEYASEAKSYPLALIFRKISPVSRRSTASG